MKSEQLEQIKTVIQETIEKKVNGKIDRLQDAFDEHSKDDKEWKEGAKPALDVVRSAMGFGKTALYLIGFVGAIVALIKGIETLKK